MVLIEGSVPEKAAGWQACFKAHWNRRRLKDFGVQKSERRYDRPAVCAERSQKKLGSELKWPTHPASACARLLATSGFPSLGLDLEGRTIWIVDAHGYGKRFIVHAHDMVTALLELRAAIQRRRESQAHSAAAIEPSVEIMGRLEHLELGEPADWNPVAQVTDAKRAVIVQPRSTSKPSSSFSSHFSIWTQAFVLPSST